MRRVPIVWLVAAFFLAIVTPLFAQQGTSEITGKITDEQGAILGEIAKGLGETTNNVAEYTAVIEGLELAQELGAKTVTLAGGPAFTSAFDPLGVGIGTPRTLAEGPRTNLPKCSSFASAASCASLAGPTRPR